MRQILENKIRTKFVFLCVVLCCCRMIEMKTILERAKGREVRIKNSSLLIEPTRILDPTKLHMPKADPVDVGEPNALFQYKDKEELKQKYVEWMYNAVLQQ